MDINQDFPVGNAAGWCKSIEEVRSLSQTTVAFIVVGSITLEERLGNSGNVFNNDPFRALNALGLPNPGMNKIEKMCPEMIHTAHSANKSILLSLAGFSSQEYSLLAARALQMRFDGIELNLGCPNVVENGKRKQTLSFNRSAIRAVLEQSLYHKKYQDDWFVSVKISPMTDPEQIIKTAELIAEFDIDAIVTQNTFPNCLDFDEQGRPVIQTPDKTGWAGGSGTAILHQALGQVNQWRTALPKNIAVWGVGGVQTGQDVQKMIWAGASAVQVGTTYFISGAKTFGDIASQYIHLTNTQEE
ncbi:MAG TPA: dihydroorotate dehydrogenase [Patescibacteria group bacterium]|nr:dihydroorotate dehydrogenase [Patescibacteria group bacterium]